MPTFFDVPAGYTPFALGYAGAGGLTFLGLIFTLTRANPRVRIACLLACLALAAVHLYCLMTLIFSYLHANWTAPGSALFGTCGYGAAALFALGGALYCIQFRRYAYCFLYAAMSALNLSPNDQEDAMRDHGAGWLLRHLFMFLFVLALCLVTALARRLAIFQEKVAA